MISMEGTNLGVTVKKLRETKGMSRVELSEAAGISEFHRKKIESGVRQPGFQTYQRMIAVLEADIVIKDMTGSIKGDCAARAQKVLLESTEAQAVFLVQVLEFKFYGLKDYDEYTLLKRSGARLPIDNLEFIDQFLMEKKI